MNNLFNCEIFSGIFELLLCKFQNYLVNMAKVNSFFNIKFINSYMIEFK